MLWFYCMCIKTQWNQKDSGVFIVPPHHHTQVQQRMADSRSAPCQWFWKRMNRCHLFSFQMVCGAFPVSAMSLVRQGETTAVCYAATLHRQEAKRSSHTRLVPISEAFQLNKGVAEKRRFWRHTAARTSAPRYIRTRVSEIPSGTASIPAVFYSLCFLVAWKLCKVHGHGPNTSTNH